MTKKHFAYIVVFAGFLFAQTGWGLNYATLTRIIRDNKVRSVDELLPLLPEAYRKYYTFVYQSRSLQASEVSPESPRIILTGQDGKFLMAFTHQGNELETIEFVDAKAAFLLRSLTFAPGKDPLSPEPEINPARCLNCHGRDPRPNWDAYNTWPGVYGSVSRLSCDTMQEGTPEFKNYMAFLAGNRKLGRYQFLPPEIIKPIVNNRCPHTLEHDYTFSNAALPNPNSKLTSQLFYLNSKRIRRLITESPSFPKFKYLWAGLAKDCLRINLDKFFPPDFVENHQFNDYATTQRELKDFARREYSERLHSFLVNNAGSKIEPTRTPMNFLDQEKTDLYYFVLEQTTWIKLVADRAKISTERWETGFSDGHWAYAIPDGPPFEMFRNWSLPSVGYKTCDELAALSTEALKSTK